MSTPHLVGRSWFPHESAKLSWEHWNRHCSAVLSSAPVMPRIILENSIVNHDLSAANHFYSHLILIKLLTSEALVLSLAQIPGVTAHTFSFTLALVPGENYLDHDVLNPSAVVTVMWSALSVIWRKSIPWFWRVTWNRELVLVNLVRAKICLLVRYFFLLETDWHLSEGLGTSTENIGSKLPGIFPVIIFIHNVITEIAPFPIWAKNQKEGNLVAPLLVFSPSCTLNTLCYEAFMD